MQIIQSIKENITLENVKKSDYWNLIAILVWGHYSEKKYQNEDDIEISEDWCGEGNGKSSHNSKWVNPDYSEEGYVRTLKAINITFTRSDYITNIYISIDGNISCYGFYTDVKNSKSPNYYTAQRNIDKTNC